MLYLVIQQPSQTGSEQVSSDDSVVTGSNRLLTREQLINDQQADPELQTIAQHAGEKHDVSNSPVAYFMSN